MNFTNNYEYKQYLVSIYGPDSPLFNTFCKLCDNTL